jgi:hypothetical protein
MNLATLSDENVRTYGEYPALGFEGRELTNVDQQRGANQPAQESRRKNLAEGIAGAGALSRRPGGRTWISPVAS